MRHILRARHRPAGPHVGGGAGGPDHENPIPRRSRSAGWPSRSATSCGCPIRAACGRRSGRDAGRLGACQLRARSARRPPLRQRLARAAVSARRATTSRRSTPTSRAMFPLAVYNRLESGFIGFDFHPEFAKNGLFYTVHGERAPGNPATPNFIPPGFTPAGRDLPQRHHRVARDEPGGEHVRRARGASCCASPTSSEPDAPDGRRRVQPDGEARRRRLRPALHQRQRSRVQQRRRAARQQSRPDAAARLGRSRAILRIDPRSPSVIEGHEGARRLHDSAGQQVRRRRRSEDARRDLRLRLPQRAPAVVGPDRRHDVRARHRHEPHRGGQHRPQRRQLRLDEARGLLGERHDPARRRAQPAVPAAGRRARRPARRTSFTYPVAIYDHDEGVAITGGFAYHGTIPALRGKFVFGDVNARPAVRRRPRGDEEGRRRRFRRPWRRSRRSSSTCATPAATAST